MSKKDVLIVCRDLETAQGIMELLYVYVMDLNKTVYPDDEDEDIRHRTDYPIEYVQRCIEETISFVLDLNRKSMSIPENIQTPISSNA